MGYTTLDLPTKLKVICLKSMQEQEIAKKDMGGARKIPGIQALCKTACQKEIDRQMVIYNKEEGEYVKEIARIHAESKALAADVEKGGDPKVLEGKCKKLEANSKYTHELAAALVAHQGFRASCYVDMKIADAGLGATVAKALEADFVKNRAPMIVAVAGVKDQRIKIDEFVKRGWDLLQAQAKKGGGGGGGSGGVDVATLAKELSARTPDFAEVAAEVEKKCGLQLNNMQKFVIALNTKKLTKPIADIEFKRAGDYDKTTKGLRSQVKTLGIALESFKKRLGESAKNPKIAPLLAVLEKHEKFASDGAIRLNASQEAYNKKIEDAKKMFK